MTQDTSKETMKRLISSKNETKWEMYSKVRGFLNNAFWDEIHILYTFYLRQNEIAEWQNKSKTGQLGLRRNISSDPGGWKNKVP